MRKTLFAALVASVVACGDDGKKKDKEAAPDDQGQNQGNGDGTPGDRTPGGQPPGQGSGDGGGAGNGGGHDPAKTYVLEPGQGIASARGAFIAHLTWPLGLASESEIKARLTFAKIDRTKPATVILTKFDPQMPSMGHGTDVADQAFVAEDAHVVRIDGVWINMGGDWVIRVHATVDGEADVVEIPVDDVP